MNRRCRFGVIFAALTLHALVPFAAYAGSAPAAGFNDYCSVYRNAAPQAPAIPSLPAGKHLTTHCAYCPGGSAAAAIAPPVAATALLAGAVVELPLPGGVLAHASARILLPPSRAPPPDRRIDSRLG